MSAFDTARKAAWDTETTGTDVHQGGKYARLNQMSPGELFAAQKAWRAEHQASLQAHLRKTESGASCAPEWPPIPATAEGVAL